MVFQRPANELFGLIPLLLSNCLRHPDFHSDWFINFKISLRALSLTISSSDLSICILIFLPVITLRFTSGPSSPLEEDTDADDDDDESSTATDEDEERRRCFRFFFSLFPPRDDFFFLFSLLCFLLRLLLESLSSSFASSLFLLPLRLADDLL